MKPREPENTETQPTALTYRDVRLSDVTRIAALAGEWDVARMTGRVPYPYSDAAAVQWIEDLLPGEIVKAIVKDNELIGICGMAPHHDDNSTAEIGYWIGKPYWGQGYATAAGQWLIALAFKDRSFDRLTGGHFNDNPASGRVMEKLGFSSIEPCTCWCEARGCNVDAQMYELHRPRGWFRRQRSRTA